MSDIIEKIESHWDTTVSPSIIEQYRGSTHWKAQLKSVIDQIQKVEDDAYELSTILDFEDSSSVPTGKKLDWMASLVNVTRRSGESDSAFFTRFKETVNTRTAGTPDYIIGTVKQLSGTSDEDKAYVIILEDAPASFLVYTPKGRQLYRRQVKQTAPAGVLGLPGAALCFTDGSFIGTVDGESEGEYFLAVADDASVGSDSVELTDDEGVVLTDGSDNTLTI